MFNFKDKTNIIIVLALFAFGYQFFTGDTLNKPILDAKTLELRQKEVALKEELTQARKRFQVDEKFLAKLENIDKYDLSVATYSKAKPALDLKTKLDLKGYISHIYYEPNEKLYTVLIGPIDTVEEAADISSQIKENYGIDVELVPNMVNYPIVDKSVVLTPIEKRKIEKHKERLELFNKKIKEFNEAGRQLDEENAAKENNINQENNNKQ